MTAAGNYPYGYDIWTWSRGHTEVIPKLWPVIPKLTMRLRIAVSTKAATPQARPGVVQPARTPPPPPTSRPPAAGSEITVQLTADQQVELSISGEDNYGNPVDVTGDIAWWSSNEAVVRVFRKVDDHTKAVAVAVGPVGTAAITVTNDVDQDGTGDFQGSLAIDVVAGEIAEITVQEGAVGDKPVPDQSLPGSQPGPDQTLPPGVDNTLPQPPEGTEPSPPRPDQSLPEPQPLPDQSLPGDQPRPDQSLPGDQPRPDQSLPGAQPRPDQSLPEPQPLPDQSLPGAQPHPDQTLPGDLPQSGRRRGGQQ